MRQSSIIELQKDDPLKRIQEEISEVTRREQELRELNTNHVFNGNTTTTKNSLINQSDTHHDITATSDDSGISSSSSPVNGTSANVKDLKYIRSNTINPTSSQIQHYSEHKLTRAMSTPQIFIPTTKKFAMNTSNQKGIMRRFIASRGKLATSANKLNNSILTSAELNRPILFTQLADLTPPIIERDEDGRPLRKGYIPVEEKIQKELREMKSRESELKQLRRRNMLRQSQPNLADAVDCSQEFDLDSDDDDDDEEHCYGPRKLRSSKSISELCDTLDTRATPSPQLSQHDDSTGGTLRPAVSLAQLCDIDPEATPSSHRLIAQWENIIQKHQTQEVI